ncbi:unnamed protein product [Penicillium salamii]|nr:unnamed protein product [Penicillium salamii]
MDADQDDITPFWIPLSFFSFLLTLFPPLLPLDSNLVRPPFQLLFFTMTASDKNSSPSSPESAQESHDIISPITAQSSRSPPPDCGPLFDFETSSPQMPIVCSARTIKSVSEALALITTALKDHSTEVNAGARVKLTDVPPALGPLIIAVVEEDRDSFPRKYRKSWNSRDLVLYLKVPTRVHNSVQRWWIRCTSELERNSIITPDEKNEIDGEFGTTLHLPSSPYSQSIKEPDVLIDPFDDLDLPSVVIECGWSESADELEADAEMLLRGSAGQTRVAVLVKFHLSKAHARVYGEASVWELDGLDQLVKRQTETIFPQPTLHQTQALRITRGELWRGALGAMRNPREPLNFSIDILREFATERLEKMGLRPA